MLGARAAENDPEHLALWIEVTGTNGNAYTYDIYFQALSEAAEGDSSYEIGELTVVVPASSVDMLQRCAPRLVRRGRRRTRDREPEHASSKRRACPDG